MPQAIVLGATHLRISAYSGYRSQGGALLHVRFQDSKAYKGPTDSARANAESIAKGIQ
jgi:hypothetical protein